MTDKLDSENRVISYIRKGIISGSWAIGEKIPSEHELCAALSVGRATVRDALAQYIAIGLLKSVHGKGTFVCSNNLPTFGSGSTSEDLIKNILPVLEFRHMIEPELCYQATINSSPVFIATLEQYLIDMNASIDSVPEFCHNDKCFHLEIVKATKNSIAHSVMMELFQQNKEALYKLNQTIGMSNAIYYHTQILEAIKMKDSKKARSLMNEHIGKTMSELLLTLI